MTTVKFRGRSKWVKGWLKGNLIVNYKLPSYFSIDTKDSIVPIAVDEDSIGMLWKLDAAGKEIYENDYVCFREFLIGEDIIDYTVKALVGRNEDGFTLTVVDSPFVELFDFNPGEERRQITVPASSFISVGKDSLLLVEDDVEEHS